jgi:hypothetical protein
VSVCASREGAPEAEHVTLYDLSTQILQRGETLQTNLNWVQGRAYEVDNWKTKLCKAP